MQLTIKFNALLTTGQTWQDRVLEADQIWGEVKAILDTNGEKLPQTPRRPDVRMIVNNISGQDIQFQNPGDHSGNKMELIPGIGDKAAAMIMVKGATLEEQHKNAGELYQMFNMAARGLSQEFVDALRDGELAHLVDEAYGPAPFAAQAEKLVDVAWTSTDKKESMIKPIKGAAAAYGARAATNETVFLAQFPIFVKGTGTTPEIVDSVGMCIAISEDWQTKAVTTRPIVPSVAEIYYGKHFDSMPVAVVHPDGMVKEIDLKRPAPPKITPPKLT